MKEKLAQQNMAEKADGHAIDVERLSSLWPEQKALKVRSFSIMIRESIF